MKPSDRSEALLRWGERRFWRAEPYIPPDVEDLADHFKYLSTEYRRAKTKKKRIAVLIQYERLLAFWPQDDLRKDLWDVRCAGLAELARRLRDDPSLEMPAIGLSWKAMRRRSLAAARLARILGYPEPMKRWSAEFGPSRPGGPSPEGRNE